MSICSSRIDEEIGAVNISNYFADIYSDIYNRVELSVKFQDLCTKVDMEVGQHSLQQVNRITEELVGKALKMMRTCSV